MTYKPRRDTRTDKAGLISVPGQCAVYYFYHIDEDYGLMYMRVPTWLPCTMQVYFNMHHYLENRLRAKSIAFETQDNSIAKTASWRGAQRLADTFETNKLERRLNGLAAAYCPIVKNFSQGVYWTIKQIEYSLDIAFKSAEALGPLYEQISRQAVLSVRMPDITRFWDRRVVNEASSDHKTLAEATRIKHQCGKQSLKMYDKGGKVLRTETTSNDITVFKHYRKVVSPDKTVRYKNAALSKTIHNLGLLRGLMHAVCKRYLDYVGALEEHAIATGPLDKVSAPARDKQDRSLRGFNLFLREDRTLLEAIQRGEQQIQGLSNKTLRSLMKDKSSGQVARILRRLRSHGLIKKVRRTYRYYLTKLGGRVLSAACKLRRMVILPALDPRPANT